MPQEWEPAVRRWAEHNDRYRTQGYPDRTLEYLAYQTLVGAWPLDAERLGQFLLKAAREAKVHTSWINPVAAYEDALAAFVESVMSDVEFTSDLESFLGRTQLVSHGRTTSLAQTALLLTAPGVPDLYQGSELWQLTLVDPDNRRPVDYESRQKLLAEVVGLEAAGALARADEGVTKLWLIARLLGERLRRPDVFAGRDHAPLQATGAKARHALGFVRGPLLVVVPRLVAQLGADWGDTELELPRGAWTSVLTGETRGAGVVRAGELLAAFPVAVLARQGA
jgi:(1->4)-alpha-D-glucan 1-alpha-D-glucosylmutase